MKASLQQQPMYCSRDHNYPSRLNQQYEKSTQRLQRLPVLHMPDKVGRFQLYSDTSKYATGGAFYQIQNGKPKLIAYSSKRLPEAAHSYSITELEM